MSDVDVYVDLTMAGRLTIDGGIRPTVTFQYDPGWLSSPDAFAIDPELALQAARSWTPFVTGVDAQVGEGRLEALLATAEYFRMDAVQGRRVLGEIVSATETLSDLEDERMPADTWAHLVRIVREGTGAARALAS